MCIYIHVYIYTYIYIHTYVYIYIYIHVHVYICIYIYGYTYMDIYIYMDLYIYISIYIYMYMDIHESDHTWFPLWTQHPVWYWGSGRSACGATQRNTRQDRSCKKHDRFWGVQECSITGWWLGHPSEKYESQLGW